MTRLIGSSAILVALGLAVAGLAVGVVGARRGSRGLLDALFSIVYTNFALLALATLCMVYGLVTHDFSISYVAQVGSRSTPVFYTIISLWSALEGSILFWGFVLALYSAAVVYFNRDRAGTLVPYAAVTLLGIGAFFYLMLAGPADPFLLVSPAPADGPGPNPLLQNHYLMGVHPPLLYLGYVGMSVPFAFALGALLSGEARDDAWVKITRRWTISAWAFLSAAIIAGMWWSYEVLGWGGYWVWDPVENASFMPWLTATAFLHSVMVQERRKMLRMWNMNLIVATFLLTVLGTFLTRSGIISSVHSFTQGTIGYYFLAFIAVTFVVSVALVAGNGAQLRSESRFDSVASRETAFLLNNLLLTTFTFTVVLGTLFPLVAEAVRGVKVSVGAPFFNSMTVPLCAALLFLVGVGPALPWRRAPKDWLRERMVPPMIALVVAAAVAIAFGARHPYAVLAFAFAGFALVTNLGEFWTGARARRTAHGENVLVALGRLIASNRHRYGGYVAHIGVILIALGITASSTFKTEREGTLRAGEVLSIEGFDVRLDRMWGREEPHRTVIGADLTVLRDGRAIGTLDPRINYYRTSDQPIVTPAVRSRAKGDLYINLMAFERDGSAATLRVIVEPLVPWIWFGGGVVCLGALIAIWPTRRSRVTAAPVREPIRSQVREPVDSPASGVPALTHERG